MPAGGSISFSFSQTADLSNVATYSITSATLLAGDFDPSNDQASTSVTNVSCATTDATDVPITISSSGTPTIESTITVTDDFEIEDVNVTLNILHTWASDIEATLISPEGTSVLLFADVGGSGDNFTNTVLDDDATQSISDGSAPFTGTFSPQNALSAFNGEQTVGDWTLSVFDDANLDGGSLEGWSVQLCGNTNLSIEENSLDGSLEIVHLGDSQYEIRLTNSQLSETLDLEVFNIAGQKLYWQSLNNSNNRYVHQLDMSYAATGIYMVRIGNNNAGIVKKIIVE